MTHGQGEPAPVPESEEVRAHASSRTIRCARLFAAGLLVMVASGTLGRLAPPGGAVAVAMALLGSAGLGAAIIGGVRLVLSLSERRPPSR